MTTPPRRTTDTGRFAKGKSGNPKGRPKVKADKHKSAFNIVIDRTLSITRDGVLREISVEEALQHRTYQEAIAGKRMAQRQVMKWIEKREAWMAKKGARKAPVRQIETKMSPDPNNANEALQILGVITTEGSDTYDRGGYFWYQLEPWAVQAALDRRRKSTSLDEKHIYSIKGRTLRADTVHRPDYGEA